MTDRGSDDGGNATSGRPPGVFEHDALLRVAADWWLRVRDASPESDVLPQWLAWVSADPRHLRAYEEVVELGGRIERLDPSVRRQLRDEFVPESQRPKRWLAVAAAGWAAVMVAGGGYLLWREHSIQPAWQQYRTAVAENREIDLPDGSHVTIGGDSQLRVRMQPDRRDVVLVAGEAYLEVVHDDLRPFYVHAGPVIVRDLGTAFDVRQTGKRIEVMMVKGLAQICDGRQTLKLGAGKQVMFDPAISYPVVTPVGAGQVMAWRHHRLEFVNEPLADVIADVNRYSRHPIRLADPGLGRLRFTGSIRTDAIDGWVAALPDVLPVRVSPGAAETTIGSPAERPDRR